MGPGFPLPIDVLRRAYDAVVLAYGFSSQDRDHDRMLGLDLESRTANVVSARDFVGWYNGYPLEEEGGGIGGDATTHTTSAATSLNLLRHHRYRLDQTRHVAIVGMGNVALDIARILLSRPSPLSTTDIDSLDLLSTTDISHEALDMLRKSRVEHVSILGRRGPLEV